MPIGGQQRQMWEMCIVIIPIFPEEGNLGDQLPKDITSTSNDLH